MAQHIPIIRYENGVLNKLGNPQDYIVQHYSSKAVQWVLNSAYRKAVQLEPWLEQQVSEPAQSVLDFMDKYIPGHDHMTVTNDVKVIIVLKAVMDNIQYVTDGTRWGVPEYWATADETLTKTTVVNGITYGPKEGDCEDGAILIYIICRLLGVPRENLYIWCGNVVGGGHACCIYRPIHYPFQFAFLDWCYYPIRFPIDGDRYLYNIDGISVIGEQVHNGQQNGNLDTHYQKMWFMVNEKESFLSVRYKV